jgi:hypothetical protein
VCIMYFYTLMCVVNFDTVSNCSKHAMDRLKGLYSFIIFLFSSYPSVITVADYCCIAMRVVWREQLIMFM